MCSTAIGNIGDASFTTSALDAAARYVGAGVWVSYEEEEGDWAVTPFASELHALRYAVASAGRAVVFVPFACDVSDIIKAAEDAA